MDPLTNLHLAVKNYSRTSQELTYYIQQALNDWPQEEQCILLHLEP